MNGLPRRVVEKRDNDDGDIGEHEHREGDGVPHLLGGGAIDIVPLGDGGDDAQHKHGKIQAQEGLQQARGQNRPVAAVEAVIDGRAQIHRDGSAGQHRRGHDVHGHIEAGEAAPEDAPEQGRAVAAEHLQIAPGPAQPLAEGLAEGGGLLVIQHGGGAIAHLFAPDDVGNGELDILGQQEEVPAAALLQNPAGEQEARAADGAGAAQTAAGAVEVAALPQEPQGVTGADPVVAVVLGVTVAGDDLVAVGEGLVDLGNIVGGQHVVGVQHQIAVIGGVIVLDAAQQVLQGVALAHLRRAAAKINRRTVSAGHRTGQIGAVVGHHEDIHLVGGIVLCPDAVDEVADDGLLVAGGDEDGDAVGHRLTVRRVLFEPRHGDIEELVGIAEEKRQHNGEIDDL